MCAPHPVPRGQRAYARPARRGASPGAGGAGPRRRRRTELRREGTGATARKLTENMGILYKNERFWLLWSFSECAPFLYLYVYFYFYL